MYEIEAYDKDQFYAAFFNSLVMPKNDFDANLSVESIESILDNNLPIVALIKNTIKSGLALRERILIRNTVYFLRGFQSEELDLERLEEYRDKLHKDKAFFEREITHIIVLLDGIVDTIKAEIIGCLWLYLINGRINNQKFNEYCDLTNRLFISDIQLLFSDKEKEEYQVGRMAGLGMFNFLPSFNINSGSLYINEADGLTQFGKEYKELISGVVMSHISESSKNK